MRIRFICSNFKFERWRDVSGFEGYYRISDHGRLKSLSRLMWNGNSYWKSTEKIMVLNIGTDGYYTIRLAKDGYKYDRRIHVLVAIAFCKHVPDGVVSIAHHKDENKLNNYYKNLASESIRSNTSISMLGKMKSSKYTGSHWDKAGCKWMSCIRYSGRKRYLGSFDKDIDAGNMYSIALSHISNGTFEEWHGSLGINSK